MKLPDEITRVSYRQYHHWVTRGYLPGSQGQDPRTSGLEAWPPPREWGPAEINTVILMGELRDAGVEAPRAGKIALKADRKSVV